MFFIIGLIWLDLYFKKKILVFFLYLVIIFWRMVFLVFFVDLLVLLFVFGILFYLSGRYKIWVMSFWNNFEI